MAEAPFPLSRPRRLRNSPAMRALTRETTLTPSDLIWPLFVTANTEAEAVLSMPGVFRLPISGIINAAREAKDLGIPAICIFPSVDPSLKSASCQEAWNPDNLANQAIRAVKDAVPDIAIMTDVALDPYNIYGHDGILREGEVVNDETVDALIQMSLAQARAGADILGPSDMMDGRIRGIRSALESEHFQNVAIMSYSAKFASAYYGPFRDAVGASGRLSGDKKTYQLDPANRAEALRMISRDILEGADMVMVKPGMPYLDICREAADRFDAPLFAYQVSGEYAMIRAAGDQGWLDEEKSIMESLLAFKRAGCAGVLTYFAPMAARLLG